MSTTIVLSGTPGESKSITLADGYQPLATLLGHPGEHLIVESGRPALGILLSAKTYGAEIAWGSSMPAIEGHPIAAGSTAIFMNTEAIRLAWVRSDTAGSASVLIATLQF